jgi:oligopeptide/dipeptide ABC transporter ATP-binding protein
MESLLKVRDLRTYFHTDDGLVKAVDGVDFEVAPGQALGIVGESGCGKSVTARSIMRLLQEPPAKIESGEILFRANGSYVDIASLGPRSKEMRALRGERISMIFQEPMNSLSPVHTVGDQIVEIVRLHRGVTKQEARELAVELLARVRIPRPAAVVDEYPHQLSGGMRQRAMIALALSCDPSLLIADEPTTALDVTVQAQILRLIRELQLEREMSLILITHDMGVIAQTADMVAVVYLGKVVEYAPVARIFASPYHPYTEALFASIPKVSGTRRLHPIQGRVPDPYQLVKGCPFRDRCTKRFERCESDQVPALYEVEPGHTARCYLYEDRSVEGDL